MEEPKQHQIYFLCEILNERFDLGQWNIIRNQPPELFLKRQEIILKKLLHEKMLFQKYFDRFYSNHVKLLNWSTLAIQNKTQINSYVFKNLLNKGNIYFNKKVKQANSIKMKQKKTQIQSINGKQIKKQQDQLYSEFFYLMLDKNKNQNNTRRNYSKQKARIKQDQIMDGHEFYIRTFDACNGWKYIFYNYQKHMKGLSQKGKYNNKIRQAMQKSYIDPKNKNNLGLLDYQHQQKTKIKSQLKTYNLSSIIGNTSLNSIKNFKTIIKCSSNGKLVFKNHQGKPISYSVVRH